MSCSRSSSSSSMCVIGVYAQLYCTLLRLFGVYMQLPMSPRPTEGGEVCGAGSSRRKVLRKEREGELYLMIFNACREMYHRLYHKQCIGGSALLSLNTSLDLANDFAVGKVRQNPIRAWANVLQEDAEQQKPKSKRAVRTPQNPYYYIHLKTPIIIYTLKPLLFIIYTLKPLLFIMYTSKFYYLFNPYYSYYAVEALDTLAIN